MICFYKFIVVRIRKKFEKHPKNWKRYFVLFRMLSFSPFFRYQPQESEETTKNVNCLEMWNKIRLSNDFLKTKMK